MTLMRYGVTDPTARVRRRIPWEPKAGGEIQAEEPKARVSQLCGTMKTGRWGL
jgi:hypothetical protein